MATLEVFQRLGESELIAKARQALGADCFDDGFAAGLGLSRQEAVRAVHDGRGAGVSGC
jgi:hypothetical protein